jgi:hypothetical protein
VDFIALERDCKDRIELAQYEIERRPLINYKISLFNIMTMRKTDKAKFDFL